MIYTVISFQIMTIRRRVIWPRFDFDLAILTHSRQHTCTHGKTSSLAKHKQNSVLQQSSGEDSKCANYVK